MKIESDMISRGTLFQMMKILTVWAIYMVVFTITVPFKAVA